MSLSTLPLLCADAVPALGAEQRAPSGREAAEDQPHAAAPAPADDPPRADAPPADDPPRADAPPADDPPRADTPAPDERALADESTGTGVSETGNRVTYTPRYFARYNVVTARDMLERIPGIRSLLDGGGGQRGFGNSGDQVLINGRRLSGKSIDIRSTVDRIQARQVDRIEVIRGTVEGLDVRSRGRVVNLALTEALTTGFGSWESSWSHYSDGRGVPGAEVNYSRQLGALNFVLSSEVDKRLGRRVGKELFYTPENTLF